MNKKLWPALIMALLMVVCWGHPAAAYALKVKAWIDGKSQLIIQGNTVQWHNSSFYAPGYETPYGDPPAPTYLTTKNLKTVAWTPGTWSGGTYGDTTSDKFTGLSAPLAAVEHVVTLTAKYARGSATITQQPSAVNKYALIVDFDDTAFDSASWYEISLEYTSGGVPFQFLGFLEGMTNSRANALNAKGQATGKSGTSGYLASRAFVWDPKAKTMRDLGTPAEWTRSDGAAINKKGQIAGYMASGDLHHIFFWDPVSGMQDLGNLGGNVAVMPLHCMNDQGQICGSSEISVGGPLHAFLWDPKNPGAGLQDLGTLPGGTYSFAECINSKGQVVGEADSGGQPHAFLWDPKNPGAGLQDLGIPTGGTWSKAAAINSKGQVVGKAYFGGLNRAFLWDPKDLDFQDLATLPDGTGSRAYAMNSKGQVVGEADSGGQWHTFLWDPKHPGLQDLGTLPGGAFSYASGINSKGQVYGQSGTADGNQHGFFWDPKIKVMVDLGTFSGGTTSGAYDLNAKKQVAGYATDADGNEHAVIWTP
jgi:probable HAF family extracellular repeat protein